MKLTIQFMQFYAFIYNLQELYIHTKQDER